MPWPALVSRRVRLAVAYVHASQNLELTIGAEATDFWGAVQSDGYDVLFCDAAGTVLAHQRTTWTLGVKAVFKITAPSIAVGAVRVCYLYAGASAAVVADPSTTVSGTLTTAQAGLDLALPVAVLSLADPVVTGTGATPGERVPLVVGAKVAVLCPVVVALSAAVVNGGRELEDVAGLTVTVAPGTGETTPDTPANWIAGTDIRVITSPTRGVGVLVLLSPDEVSDAVLRVTVYLSGPTSGALPSRTVVSAATLGAVAPLEI